MEQEKFAKRSSMQKTVIIIFIINVIIRFIISNFPKAILVYPDELIYLNLSRSILHGQIAIHNVPRAFDQILYPLLLTPIMLLKNQQTSISVVSLLNSVLMSSVVFPVYMMSKKIFDNKKASLVTMILVLLLPDFMITTTFMSENLFYPLSVWLFFTIYYFWDAGSDKKKTIYCSISSLLCFLLYITKIVSIYFVFAFLVMLLFDIVITKSNTKSQNIKQCIIFISLFCFMFVIFKSLVLLLDAGSSIYGLRPPILDFTKITYFFYAFTYNSMYALIAFFYFPIVYTTFGFQHFNKKEKNTFVFAITSLFFAIGITTTTISINEDYPLLNIRQHVRYFAPLLVIFIILFVKQILIKKQNNMSENPNRFILISSFTTFFCMLVLSILRFTAYSSPIDGVLLQLFSYLYTIKPNTPGDINHFFASPIILIVKLLLIILISLFSFLLFRAKYNKYTTYSLFIIMFIGCCLNNSIIIKQYYNQYGRSLDQINEVISINNFISDKDANILVITDNFDNILETYITHPAYWVKTKDVINEVGKNDFIDLEQQTLTSNYPHDKYMGLHSIDYIITTKGTLLDVQQSERVSIHGVANYIIYETKDNSKLYLRDNSYFPREVGQKRTIKADEHLLYTQHKVDDDGSYISTEQSGALVYGPYAEIQAGKYNITFNFEYKGNLPSGEIIGNADIHLVDIAQVVASMPLKVGENNVTLENVIIDRDINQAETRIFTDKQGLKFVSISIARIE